MNRRQLAKTGFFGLCGALLGKKVAEPVKSLTASTEGGSRLTPMDKIYIYREYRSTEPIPPGWDFLNDPEEDVYDG